MHGQSPKTLSTGYRKYAPGCHAEPERSISSYIGMRDASLRLRPDFTLSAAEGLSMTETRIAGRKGWVALRLDLADVDREQVAEWVSMAYRLFAPKRLVAQHYSLC
jgi:hypothetical protein